MNSDELLKQSWAVSSNRREEKQRNLQMKLILGIARDFDDWARVSSASCRVASSPLAAGGTPRDCGATGDSTACSGVVNAVGVRGVAISGASTLRGCCRRYTFSMTAGC